jgi:poly(A) polymerase
MVERGILKPVVPEIDEEGVERLTMLVHREGEAGLTGDPVRRLAALLPAQPDVVDALGKRLRLATKTVRRLVAAAARSAADDQHSPAILAYRLDGERATDRLLLSDRDPAEAASLADWQRPRLAVGGGKLIELGLPAGPIVAQTLQEVQRKWAEAGFPADEHAQLAIARQAVDQALRDSQ